MTRRAALVLLAARAAAGKGRDFPPELKRYADALTELLVTRLTSPEHASSLPGPHCRAVARNASFLVYASDRTGAWQLFRLDQRTGVSRQLTEAEDVDPGDFTLLPGDRSVLYWRAGSLRERSINNNRDREIYRIREGWRRAPGFAATGDGKFAFYVEAHDGVHELRMAAVRGGAPRTVMESAVAISDPVVRPDGGAILYRGSPQPLWIASVDAGGRRPVATTPGAVGVAYWNPDGQSVLYLSTGADGRVAIRQSGDTDRLVAPTTRYAHFAPNSDASVFVGASASPAQPHVMLLLHVNRRERTICEHRAHDAGIVAPVFSPDSQRVYFVSDAAGKPAIHAVSVEQLVEATY